MKSKNVRHGDDERAECLSILVIALAVLGHADADITYG